MIQNQNISDSLSHSQLLPEVGDLYRHYKGNLYKIIAVGRHSETHEVHVVYQALYDSKEFGNQAIWIRPLELFVNTVILEGKEISRFSKAEVI